LTSRYLKECVDYWGYEFFKGEEAYPLSCGGWFTPSSFGVRTDLLFIPDVPDDRLARAAYACLNHKIKMPTEKVESPLYLLGFP